MKRLYFFKPSFFDFIFVCFVVLTCLNLGFSQKQDISKADKRNQDNLKIKVNFNESPNKEDFFSENNETRNYNQIIALQDLKGTWIGKYELIPKSIFWINQNPKKTFFLNSTYFGPYNIQFDFISSPGGNNSGLEIIQDDTKYKNVTFQLANDKQINYWADAVTKNWSEVIRGKIFKINDTELLCMFQTTVYENKVPIYAFNGDVVLSKMMEVGYNK